MVVLKTMQWACEIMVSGRRIVLAEKLVNLSIGLRWSKQVFVVIAATVL